MKPRIGLLLGDPTGVGPEMAAKLLADPEIHERADVLVIGDTQVLRAGAAVAKVEVGSSFGFHEVTLEDFGSIPVGRMSPVAGAWVYRTLKAALGLAQEGVIDGFCFAPPEQGRAESGRRAFW